MQNQETKTPYVPRIKQEEKNCKAQRILDRLNKSSQTIASQAKETVAEGLSGGFKQAFSDWVEHKPGARSVLIPCEKLRFDNNQPFRMYTEEEIDDLAERIKQIGLLNPIIVRKNFQEAYEILSGRNRAKAVMKLGFKEIAAFVRDVDDDEAALIMLNANLGQRQNLLPSEKAKAYKIEADILNRQGQKSTSGNVCQKEDTREIMSKKHNESGRSIANYIRLAYLIPELLEYVDEKKIPLLTGVELSYLDIHQQQIIFESFISKGLKPNKGQLSEIRKLAEERSLCYMSLRLMLEDTGWNKYSKYIKIDKSKLAKYENIFNKVVNLEEFFIELIEKYYEEERSDAM